MRTLRMLPLVFCIALSGCAVPYQSPEAKHQISQELGVNAGDIINISETNFCALSYGSEAVCHAEAGLGVLTSKALILTVYSFGHYRPALTLKPENVLCGSTVTSREKGEPVNMYTTEYAAVLLPLDGNGHWNGPMHAQIIDVMLGARKPLLIGVAGKSSKKSDKSKLVAGIIPGTTLPYAASIESQEQINPCPAAIAENTSGTTAPSF
ncbi:hypothetical protein N5D61_20940 [Pseudomonas sp. GD03842]|uniref:hypothetical protein n=1 Tax=Pseudomonas sp. GD03842 TaxID=2975385 RepID=UPI002448F28D|nr:hypothetical protein [Pseudomonas sp. GD03842]MDH0748796.1 hypothetical protein [Pseudomonas sp. GD03842]